MKIEIWSDVVCPFCYIGKRRLENALSQFPHRDEVEITWRSFELDPNAQPTPGQSIHEALAAKKGVSTAEARRMGRQVTQVAQEVGLDFDFERAIPANTMLAHQLIHLAAKHGQQDAAKERLLHAYFIEGQDINAIENLVKLATELGLDATETREALTNGTYTNAVRYDEYQAQQINVRGVPFFVFDDKYAVSGAQPSELFAEVLEKAWAEQKPAPVVVADGEVCGPEGCD